MSVGKAQLEVVRVNGADGRVTVRYRTTDIDAIANKDYEPSESEIVFEHREVLKIIAIPIVNDPNKKNDGIFAVELFEPTGGAQFGKNTRMVVTIINDDDYKAMADRMALLAQVDMDELTVTKTS